MGDQCDIVARNNVAFVTFVTFVTLVTLVTF